MSTAAKVRRHLYIGGQVQGVCFRATTCDRARMLGVTGWVRNLPDGRVEVLAEGNTDSVDALVAWCRRGPPGARVEGVDMTQEDYMGQFADFSVVR